MGSQSEFIDLHLEKDEVSERRGRDDNAIFSLIILYLAFFLSSVFLCRCLRLLSFLVRGRVVDCALSEPERPQGTSRCFSVDLSTSFPWARLQFYSSTFPGFWSSLFPTKILTRLANSRFRLPFTPTPSTIFYSSYAFNLFITNTLRY